MINQDQRDELKEMLEMFQKRDLEIYYGVEYLAKEYLSLYKRYQKLKSKSRALEN